jgi:hypothetical protein
VKTKFNLQESSSGSLELGQLTPQTQLTQPAQLSSSSEGQGDLLPSSSAAAYGSAVWKTVDKIVKIYDRNFGKVGCTMKLINVSFLYSGKLQQWSHS